MKFEEELYVKLVEEIDDEEVKEVYDNDEFLKVFTAYIKEALTEKGSVEVDFVKHGEWIGKTEMERRPDAKNYTCSECGKEGTQTNYCPNCGAIMMGGLDK